jgi:dTDP-4-amino-4,6-dideoxygalactose transaminase
LVEYLGLQNIPTAIFYKNPFNKLDIYKKEINEKFDISNELSTTILSLPMHPYLEREDQNIIINLIKKYLK